MRVLHWTESFWPRHGGAERITRLLATDLVARGHACLVVSDEAHGLPAVDEIDRVAVRRFPLQATLAQRALPPMMAVSRRVIDMMRDWRPDIVHVHSSQPGAFFFLRTRRAVPAPVIYTTHDPHGGRGAPLQAQVIATATRVAAISQYMAKAVVADGIDRDRVRCVPNALPWPIDPPVPLPERPVVLGLGRLTRDKGFDVLLRAFARVAEDVPSCTLAIGGEGPARASLETLAASLGIDARVTWTGWIDQAQTGACIDRARLVVVPSRWQEPFGLVALEAMQRGRPVVASRVGGLPEIVADDETGLLVAADDDRALAGAMMRALDAEHAARMGACARARARQFDWSACVDTYEALYREVAS